MATAIRRRPPTQTRVARTVRRPPARPTPPPATSVADLARRMQLDYVDITDITPYPFNARDNEKAIPAVAKSIEQFGFLIPCVVDNNNVLVAGHTRVEAAKLLGMTEVPVIRASHLTRDQINAFRLIDNKVSEIAAWDFDLLAGELNKLTDLGLDFTSFGWSQADLDCLSEVVTDTCLTAAVEVPQEQQNEVSQRRAPSTARTVIGEFVFFIPASDYRAWADGLRNLCQFDEEAITAELKRRLGMPA